MNELRNLAREGVIADFLDEPPILLTEGKMTGVSLRIDEYWLAWYWSRHYHGPWHDAFKQRSARTYYGHRYDFSQLPDYWFDRCRKKGFGRSAHPVTIIVILRDEPKYGIPEAWPRFVGDHPVIYEYRPEALLQAVAPGDSVSGITSGTLGGYLWQATSGQYFALSCAHVFGHMNNSTVYSGGKVLGNVVDTRFPPVSLGKCNNRIKGTVSDHAVDVAVADLSGGIPIHAPIPGIGKVVAQTPIADIGQGDLVMLNGAASGKLVGKVKECNIWKELTFRGNNYCFGDLLVIEDLTYHYVASQFTRAGDSGAWVTNSEAGYISWDAMHIAGDGANSYCCYAENIMDLVNLQLTLPP